MCLRVLQFLELELFAAANHLLLLTRLDFGMMLVLCTLLGFLHKTTPLKNIQIDMLVL